MHILLTIVNWEEFMVTLAIPAPKDFRFQATVESHGWYQLAPFDYDHETGILSRPYKLSDGGIVTLHMRGATQAVMVEVEGRAILDSLFRNEIMRAIRAIFSLDIDLKPFYKLMAKTEGYEWVNERKAGRLLASPTVWEDLVKTLLTTNTTWKNTCKMLEKFATIDLDNIFPNPQQIIELDPEHFRKTLGAGYRAPYLFELAERIVSGELDVESWRNLESLILYKTVIELTGFGDYAAGTMLRLLGHFDRLAIDSVARHAYKHLTGQDSVTDKDIREYYKPFGDWRGLVLWMDCIRKE